jgi:hypothetical protein
MSETVNDRLHILTKWLDISPFTLGEMIGVSKQTFYDYVAGKKRKPAFEVLEKLKEALPELDMNWVVCGKGISPMEWKNPNPLPKKRRKGTAYINPEIGKNSFSSELNDVNIPTPALIKEITEKMADLEKMVKYLTERVV